MYTLYTYDATRFSDPIIALGKKAKRIASYVFHESPDRVLTLLNNPSDVRTEINAKLADMKPEDRAFLVNEDTNACGLTFVQVSHTEWIKYE